MRHCVRMTALASLKGKNKISNLNKLCNTLNGIKYLEVTKKQWMDDIIRKNRRI